MNDLRESQVSFKVFFINLGYGLDREFASIPEAVEAGKKAHFEFTVSDDQGVLHLGWGPVSGMRGYTEAGREAISQLVASHDGLAVMAEIGDKTLARDDLDWRKCPICSVLFADGGISVVAESDGEVVGHTTVSSGEQAANWIAKHEKGKPMSRTAVAYYRTSSAVNAGDGKDSLPRQQEAVHDFAKHHKLDIVREFYDPAVSGADPIEDRPGFSELLAYLASNGARIVLVENASRFARDLGVQIAGHDLLKERGFELVAVDAPDYFTNETPTAVMVRQILGAVSQFEKAMVVQKLRHARDRKSRELGRRIEGRPPFPDAVVALAKRLRRNRRTGKQRSLREISGELAKQGHLSSTGKLYVPASINRMLRRY